MSFEKGNKAFNFKDMTGQRFGRLVAIGVVRGSFKGVKWACACDCGSNALVFGANMRRGLTKSCGCLRNEMVSLSKRTHGHSVGRKISREYRAYKGMLMRCYRPKEDSYYLYGGRGIIVCDRWRESFENFLLDMGPHPGKGFSIDRKDCNGNYEPENCRWATQLEQGANRRNNRMLTLDGETLHLREWCRRLGMNQGTLMQRVLMGWSDHKALTAPIRQSKRWHAK